MTHNNRNLFAWSIFLIIHIILVAGIAYAGVATYGPRLGAWVAASAFIAGCVSMYLFAYDVPGETLMKIVLGLAVACNAAYLVHNGARAIGVQAFNEAQVRKYEAGMTAAARAGTRRVAQEIGLSVKSSTVVERLFADDVAFTAGLLALFELAGALVIFAIATRRQPTGKAQEAAASEHQPTAKRHQYINGQDRDEEQRPN